MTPEERNLITGLFDRMRSYGNVEKEREADQMISSLIRQNPDSPYMLVQSVLIQDQAMVTANDRVQQLEARVRDLEQAAQSSQQSSGGSFLGGLFGGGHSRPAPTSVPPTRSAPPPNSPWGQPQPQQGGYAQQPQGYPMQQAAPGRAGGGFMAQAMTTAAGVAGGMLAANAITSMMHGHPSYNPAAGTDQTANDASQDAAQDQQTASDAQQDAQQDQQYAADDGSNDPGASSASDDSWGGGSDSSDA